MEQVAPRFSAEPHVFLKIIFRKAIKTVDSIVY
jgi:hypothetical protein